MSNIDVLDASGPGPFPPLQKAIDLRPELRTLTIARGGRENPAMFEGFLMAMRQTKPLYYRLVQCNVAKDDGNEMFKAGKFPEARAKYVEAAKKILGEDFVFPVEARKVKSEKYMKLVWQEMMDVVACFNNMAQCYIREGNSEQALEWLQEVAVIYMNQSFAQKTPLFYWKNTNLLIEEYYLNQQKYHLRLSQVFLKLLNTSCAVHHSWAVASISGSIATPQKPPRVTKMLDDANVMKFAQYRHPDINLPDRLKVSYPNLQIRGKWERLVTKSRPPAPRLGMATWIWRGKLYVAGGQSAMQDRVRDMWCLNLSTKPEERKWRRLVDIPHHTQGGPQEHSTAGIVMKVWEDKAWLFFGSKTVWAFDLVEETWEKKTTVLKKKKKWPYEKNDLSEYAMEVYKGKMYVFGGQDGRMQLGCNLFMALDLKDLTWELISGTSEPVATHDSPMLRVHPEAWVIPKENKLFIMYGNANRMGESLGGREGTHGAECDYTYEDIWAFSFSTKTWTREKTRGNYPCPRTEFSCAYNPRLDRTVVFGGYCGTTNTYFPDRGVNFTFAYYADTYIWNPADRKWSQVLTRGFPTYRAQARLIIDEQSGKSYLFGGYTNSDFVPSNHVVSRAFNDLWELKIDFEDGRGGIVDRVLELGKDEKRTAVMGPWGTCFCCGAVGQWKMCGGSCGGVVRYCSNDCGREAWTEHKKIHQCKVKEVVRKKT
ncbi:uncharacterized protein H6S33_002265 [Morchella sextelata]|uniref:uncharacterized protein n=1 Tax=Morchella sextelata TaxID=1174677 RepID=UPI001D03A1AD|nr:uncharacterized protein H6S33_002265 [Morchella sextelata]KAH0608213.1 hypothetical protein H6S33_002265 [Morchella sextelata]